MTLRDTLSCAMRSLIKQTQTPGISDLKLCKIIKLIESIETFRDIVNKLGVEVTIDTNTLENPKLGNFAYLATTDKKLVTLTDMGVCLDTYNDLLSVAYERPDKSVWDPHTKMVLHIRRGWDDIG